MATTNNNNNNLKVEEHTNLQKVTGLKITAYESGNVTYDGVTKWRDGGISLSKNGKFLTKLSGIEALFVYQSLKENIDFINTKIADAERKQLSSLIEG